MSGLALGAQPDGDPSLLESGDASLPDLVAHEVRLAPSHAEPGEAAEFVAEVANRGGADAGAFWVRLRLDGAIHDARLISGLTAGETLSWRSAWRVEADADEISLRIDPTERVKEADETNNVLSRRLRLAPDLAATQLEMEPRFPRPDEAVEIRVRLENRGSRDVSRTFAVQIAVDRSTVATRFVAGLTAGASRTIAATRSLRSGRRLVRARVDPFGSVANDAEEANNREVGLVDVTEREPSGADLAVRAVRLEPADPEVGQTASVQAVVANEGSGPSGTTSVTFWADGEALGAVALPTLAAGETRTVEQPWRTESGQRRLHAEADAGHLEPEPDEENNTGARTLDLGPALAPCEQPVRLRLDEDAVGELMALVGEGPDPLRQRWMPRIKRVMETQFAGINVRFVYERPARAAATVAFRGADEAPILGRAPIGRTRGTGEVFLGSFRTFGLDAFAPVEVPTIVGTVASHEIGHLFGLRHPDPPQGGIMDANTEVQPVPGGTIPMFRDEARQRLETQFPVPCSS